MSDEWVKSHREMDITTRLLYWAQNEDMIDQYYTQRGKDLLEAEEEIQKLRSVVKDDATWLASYHQWCKMNGCAPSSSDLIAASNALKEKKDEQT